LEGLEISEVSFSKTIAQTETARIDSEYFCGNAAKMFDAIKGDLVLGDLVKDGYRVVYETTEAVDRHDGERMGFPYFLQAADITTPFINQESMVCVAQSDWERYPKGRIKPGELLIEVKGKAEKIALVPDDFPPKTLVTGTCFKLTTKESTDQYFLAAYLTCRYGQALKNRLKSNLLVSYLAKDDLYRLPVPLLSTALKEKIRTVFEGCFAQNKEAISLHKMAETTLLRALNLENWQAPEPLSYVRNSLEVFAAGRLDAEHFQPKYDEVLNIVRKTNIELAPLEQIIQPIKNGFDARNFVEQGTPYIRVGDIKNHRIDIDSAAHIALTADEIKKDIALVESDVLFTRKGSFGNAAPVYKEHEKLVISSEIMLLRLKLDWKAVILPEYFALFFSSPLGNLQAEKWAHGVAFYSVSQDDLNQFLIPLLDMERQLEIQRLFLESEQNRAKSAHLLESAKRAVEIAIEDSEAAALAFLQGLGADVFGLRKDRKIDGLAHQRVIRSEW
jgi:restriction endonuclease S subunit